MRLHNLVAFIVGLFIIGAAPASAQVQSPCVRLGTGTELCAVTGSPEGVVYGNKGDMTYDSSGGAAYVKTTNGGNTGWTILTTGAASGAPAGAQYVTLATDGTLTAERVLTGTSNQVVITDNGAGSTVVLSLPQSIATASSPQFAHLGLGTAADANLLLKGSGGAWVCTLVDEGNSSTAITIDLRGGCNEHLVTLTGSVTFTLSNPADGGRYVFILDTGAGSFTATWPGTVQWPGGTAPTITTAANKVDIVTCIYRSATTAYYCAFNQAYPH